METRLQESLDCPFCKFNDTDQYELLYHVETSHPESSRPSPFSTKHAFSAGARGDVEQTGRAKTPSSEYIECQCGEFCLLAEFESHLEMHYAEGMGDEEIQKKPSLPTIAASSNKSPSTRPVPQVTNTSRDVVPSGRYLDPLKPVANRRSHSEGRKNSLIQDFIGILRFPAAPPPKSRSHGVPKRLGVRRSQCLPHSQSC